MSKVKNLARRIGRTLLGTLTHVETGKPVVALTFDDGPDPAYTPQFLELLESYGARATFFMIGKRAAQHPDLVRCVSEFGHQIGNHSWDHVPFTLLTGRERRKQLRSCRDALAPYGSPIFRPPNGDLDFGSRLDAARMGYRVVTWSVTANDWHNDDAMTLANRLFEKIRPGSIVLLHDTLYTALNADCADRKPTLEALRMVLERYKGEYQFVTVSDLIKSGRPVKTYWVRKVDRKLLDQLVVTNPSSLSPEV
jgi:peptidoglycan/xylan/chitin deacetylase (PgdA/CDA1 family)